MRKAYIVTGYTKKGHCARWRYDALEENAAEAKAVAKKAWEGGHSLDWGDWNPDCHLFGIEAKRLPDEEFPVCLGHWVKTSEFSNGKWVSHDLPIVY